MKSSHVFLKSCTTLALFLSASAALSAQTFTTLHNFAGADGSNSYAPLTQGVDGNLYGTTFGGGAQSLGTVFNLAPTGAVTVIYSFCSQPSCADGANPFAGLDLGTDNNFYGTASEDGAHGYGTVFKIKPSGRPTLHSFAYTDGAAPYGGLVEAMNYNYYGTTQSGGADGYGTIYQITAAGAVTVLHSFAKTDGSSPSGTLTLASDGNLYGTTQTGGAHNLGTIFQITPSGAFISLYSFSGPDGAKPTAGLTQGNNGNLYGVTGGGGANASGTIFEISQNGVFTSLYNFCPTSGCSDGAHPHAALVLGTDGNFYGTTVRGGANGDGVVFEITATVGQLTVLHSFLGTDGDRPYGGLVQDTNGIFYGTTTFGGANNDGTIYSLFNGLGPFVSSVPTFGKVGAKVGILGTNISGATAVAFNGTPATFTVVSHSFIEATVPSGATTGPITVTLPTATLTSNVQFIVLP